jgi:SMODS and SLOG-associating 2TM effector domain 1/Protein of unknown function (DUF4231)
MTSDAEKDDAIIQSVWNRQRQWSKAANELKSGIVKWRTSVLVLGSVGAVLQTLAATLPAAFVSSASAVVGTVALALVPALTGYYLTPEQTRKWLRARSVSEGLKSETFLFRAGAEPYCGADALGVFMEKTREIETWAGNLEPELARIQPDAKPPPGPLDPETYLVRRIQEQVDKYYRPQAALNAQRARWVHQAEILLGVAAAVLAAIATALHLPATGEAPGGLGAWVAVLTTIGASFAAHAAASRHDFQARSYYATARQLEDLRDKWRATPQPADPRAWSGLVRAVEEAISAENRGWMAKLDPEEQQNSARR